MALLVLVFLPLVAGFLADCSADAALVVLGAAFLVVDAALALPALVAAEAEPVAADFLVTERLAAGFSAAALLSAVAFGAARFVAAAGLAAADLFAVDVALAVEDFFASASAADLLLRPGLAGLGAEAFLAVAVLLATGSFLAAAVVLAADAFFAAVSFTATESLLPAVAFLVAEAFVAAGAFLAAGAFWVAGAFLAAGAFFSAAADLAVGLAVALVLAALVSPVFFDVLALDLLLAFTSVIPNSLCQDDRFYQIDGL